jgi:two-component system sensor histidine kinase/response regulator
LSSLNYVYTYINYPLKTPTLRKFNWDYFSGSDLEFTLTTRIFHSVCLISLMALAYNVPLNYALRLPFIAVASAIAFLLLSGLYYLSRVRRKTAQATLIFCILSNVLFVSNFFFNSGIDGPTAMFFILSMIVIVAIVPVRQYWYWVTINVSLFLSLNLLQYQHPDLAPYTYDLISDRYIDFSSAYITVVAVAIFSFYFIRRNYEIEKASAEQKGNVLKLLNEERNKLMSIIAHDMRSPLANIQSYLELLVEQDISEEEAKVINKSLLQSTRGTLEMLDNVLNWTKGQMDGLSFKLHPVNVFELLSPQLLVLTDIAANKKITLKNSIDPHIMVTGDGEMLQLVVRNLVSNAIKFTASGGHISVHTNIKHDACLIVVKDSGTGKPVNLTPDIFYLSGASTTGTMNEKGVGLGLVICKKYIEVQHGTPWFECDAMSGATFFVQLPLVSALVPEEDSIESVQDRQRRLLMES